MTPATPGMAEDPAALLPEALLIAGAVVTLLVGMFSARTRQYRALAVALAATLASLVLGVVDAGGHRTIYDGSYAIDVATTATRIIVAAATAITLLLARARVAHTPRETEFYVLVLLASTGTVVLAGATDLLLLAVGYLLASIPLYALVGWSRDAANAEATLKTYLMGALMSIAMLTGIAVLTGIAGGSTSYANLTSGLAHAPRAAFAFGLVAVLAGLLFKAGAVPAHFWVPDAVSGASTPAAAFASTVPKIGALVGAYRLMVALPAHTLNWQLLIAVLAAASMTLGNLAAYRQDDPKRLLAYSTISQVGYLLMAVAVAGHTSHAASALLLYLGAYAAANLGAFAVLAALPDRHRLADWRGTGRAHPMLITVLGVCLLALVGIPPTAVFLGKLTVFTATWDAGLGWLVVIAALNTVASLYYYLRWLAPAVLAPASPAASTAQRLPAAVAYLCGIGTFAAGIAAVALYNTAPTVLTR